MKAESIRPRVDQLVFHLYDRPLHPELIETVARRRLSQGGLTLTLRLTPTGHVISWEFPDLHLTEVATADDQPVPVAGRLLQHRLKHEHTETIVPRAGYCYQISSQVETLPPEIFSHVHEEILFDAGKGGLLHHFQPPNRLALPPVGYLVHDSGRGYVSLSAFHTFPDEFTVVKTQTLVETTHE
ncbi:MAG TPA: DUF2617 family protein [Gemmataceae bacterium]